MKARLSALRWRDLDERVRQRESVIGDQDVSHEALVAEQRNADASIERLRDGHHELSERFNQVQGRFYSVAGDIARVEQSIQHGQQRLRQLQDDFKEAERTRLETESHLGHDRTLLATLGEEPGHARTRAGVDLGRCRRSRRHAGRSRVGHARLAGAVGQLQQPLRRAAPSGRGTAGAPAAAGSQPGASGRTPAQAGRGA